MSDATIAAGTEQRLTAQELKAQEKAAKKAEKERLKRVARDEKAERKRAAKSGFANVANPRRSTLLTIVCALFAVYCLFPFMVLPLYTAIGKLDSTLLEASSDLGAKGYKTFLKVILPLTASGIFSGCIMVLYRVSGISSYPISWAAAIRM